MKRLVIVLLLLVLAVSIPAQNIFVPQFTSVGDTIKIPVSKPGNNSTVFDFETRTLKCAGITSTGDIDGVVSSDSSVFVILIVSDSTSLNTAHIVYAIIDTAIVDSSATFNSDVMVNGVLHAREVSVDSMANACMSFADSSVTIAIAKQIQWTSISNATKNLFTMGDDSLNTYSRNDSLFVEVGGVYNIDLQLTAGGANKDNWKFSIAINDTNTIAGCVQFTSEANSYPTSAGFCQRTLNAGDVLVPVIKNLDDANNPVVKCGGFRVTKIRDVIPD